MLKDNDMRTKICLEPDVARRVVDQLKKDSDLLAQLGVLDYSLLAGVKKFKFDLSLTDDDVGIDSSKLNSVFRTSAVSGPGVYYFGIVDFLQDWYEKVGFYICS